jgi:LysW-gamma-L-lysine carboxypeptidase
MKSDPVQLLQELVSIKSLSRQEQAAVSFLAGQMEALGMQATIDEAGNAVGVRESLDDNGQITHVIVLLGHIDTVPGDIPVRFEDGILYGRGTVDAKGPLATMVMAASQVDILPGTRLVVIGAVEEEAATSKGAHYVKTRYQPDYCIIGEPSGWDGVTLGYKGRLRLNYKLRQPMAHTAGQAKSAAEAAVDWWNSVTAYANTFNADRERLFDRILPSLSDIKTDSDGLYNNVRMAVGLRLPPDIDLADLEQTVRQLAGEATVISDAYEPAFQSDRHNLLARAFNQTLRELGQQPHFKLKTGTSDMNVVGPVWQCPIVAYGPGDSQLDHTPNEHITIGDYLKAIDVLTRALVIVQQHSQQVTSFAESG